MWAVSRRTDCCKRLMVGVSRWLVGRQLGRCVADLTMDAV